MLIDHKIKKFDDPLNFKERLNKYSDNQIECTRHTLFRLSEKQRELFTCASLRKLLLGAVPIKAGIQYNGAYAVFYKHEKERFIRVLIDIKPDKIKIITFYIIEKYQLPK